MEAFKTIDKPLLYAILTLVVAGFLILWSASMAISQQNFGTLGYYAGRQFLLGGIIGIAAFAGGFLLPYRMWKTAAIPLMVLSLVLLALLFIPELGYTAGGAKRWLDLKIIRFQPSELLKLTFIIYLASWLESRRGDISRVMQGLLPFTVMLGVIGIFLIMQPDVGTLIAIGISAVVLYFLGGGTYAHISTLAIFGAALIYILVKIAPYRLNRFLVFFNPGLDPQGIGYQINQAFIAIGSGGLWGRGFGRSVQKYNYLPEPMTDSIFAIFSEEMGLVGGFLLISLFAFILWRGLRIAKNAPDLFGTLLAGGITVGITSQAFINMAAISGLLPLTGIPLPFISIGSTSLIVTMAQVGILLNISKHPWGTARNG